MAIQPDQEFVILSDYYFSGSLPVATFVSMSNTYFPLVTTDSNPILFASQSVAFMDIESDKLIVGPVTGSGGSSSVTTYYQRVFDSTLNLWCYYSTTDSPDANPSATSTTPNHTGDLLAGSHEIIDTKVV